MEKQELIAVHEFCTHHRVEVSFVQALVSSGLVEIVTLENTGYVNRDQLPQLERLVRFHYDMDINVEGIEAIHHLLEQIKAMQGELKTLKRRLRIYER